MDVAGRYRKFESCVAAAFEKLADSENSCDKDKLIAFVRKESKMSYSDDECDAFIALMVRMRCCLQVMRDAEPSYLPMHAPSRAL
jgi:hypothetical protein